MNIVVLCGGLSPERNVSISSGGRIASALRSLGHRAALVDMYFGLEGFGGSLDEAFDLPLPDTSSAAESEPDIEKVRASRRYGGAGLFGERVLNICSYAELVFLALHGQCGEDGRVQAAFDLMGIKYTGSDYMGSALGDGQTPDQNSRRTRRRTYAGVALLPPWRGLRSSQLPPALRGEAGRLRLEHRRGHRPHSRGIGVRRPTRRSAGAAAYWLKST